MNALNIVEYTHNLGVQAKVASAQMARASAAVKSRALLALARLLRENVEPLQTDNARDLDRAVANGLSAPMVDRLRLTPKVLETCAQGCEQLASMADVIGEIIGMKQMPSGIRVGQMRVPIGVFGMIYESRPNVTIEAASLSIKSGNACILRGGSGPSTPTRRWLPSSPGRWPKPACPSTACNWCRPRTARPWASSSPCPTMWTSSSRAAARA